MGVQRVIACFVLPLFLAAPAVRGQEDIEKETRREIEKAIENVRKDFEKHIQDLEQKLAGAREKRDKVRESGDEAALKAAQAVVDELKAKRSELSEKLAGVEKEVRAKVEAAHAKVVEKLSREQAKREQARADEHAKLAEKLGRDQARHPDNLRALREELEGARAKRNKLREAGEPEEAKRADVVVEDLKRRIAELEAQGDKGGAPTEARRVPKEKDPGRGLPPKIADVPKPGAGAPVGPGIEDIGAIRKEVRELREHLDKIEGLLRDLEKARKKAGRVGPGGPAPGAGPGRGPKEGKGERDDRDDDDDKGERVERHEKDDLRRHL